MLGYLAVQIYNLVYASSQSSSKRDLSSPIVTIAVLVLMLSVDVFLHIQRLNQRVLNVDIEVTNIIEHYEKLYKKSKTPNERLLQSKIK